MPELFAPLPFQEAIDYYRGKVNIPTRRWDDLWQGMHARGFMVAGAMRDDMLADFRGAIDQAISEGTTIADFRKTFDDVVARTGWDYKGGRGWRTSVIFNTNLQTAYSAGRYRQQTDPDVLDDRPFLMYKHGDSVNPRPEHLAWDGLVLPADDPWWQIHYPPNGWGCTCHVVSLSRRDLDKMGKNGPDNAPEMELQRVTTRTGMTYEVADKGIDPGWDYNPGEAAWGRNEALRLMEGQGGWTSLDPRGPGDYGRPEKIPVGESNLGLGPIARSESGLRQALRDAVGGDVAHYTDPAGDVVEVNQALVDHMLEKPEARWHGREQYFPFIPQLITDPYEVWVTFEQNTDSGRVRVRRRYAKAIRVGKNTVIGLVAETQKNIWVNLTFFHGGLSGAGNLRVGRLVYGK